MGPENLISDYFDRRASDYLERSARGGWRWFRVRERAALLEMLRPEPGLRLLDVGCGAGFYSIPLQRDFGLSVTGIEAAPRMAAEAARRGVSVRQLNAENMSALPPASFDRVLAAGVLEFVARPGAVLTGCARILRRGGRMAVLVPRAGVAGRIYRLGHRCPVWIRKPEEYLALAHEAGFKVGATRTCTPISVAFDLEFHAV